MTYRTILADWVEANAGELARYGTYKLRFPDDNHEEAFAGHLVLETAANGVVEILVWESGEVEFAFGTLRRQTDEHHEVTGTAEFELLLERFLDQANGLATG